MVLRFVRIQLRSVAMTFAVTICAPVALADDVHAASQPARAVFKGDPYLLPTDPVTGDKLPEKPIIYYDKDGRELRFADQKNLDKFKAKPADYLPKLDQLMVKQQLPFYPLDTCPVSTEKLGGMGKPVNYIYKNRLVRFCCSGCIETCEKNPSKYIAKIDEAVVAKQGPDYPLATCVISGGKLGEMGKLVDYVVGNRLVRFCCPACIKGFSKEPLKTLKMIDDAAKKKAAATRST